MTHVNNPACQCLPYIVCTDSVLGPILFLLYTADLLRLIDGMELHSQLYADDTQIYGSCTPDAAPALQQRISTCVVRTLEWMQANRLQVNAAKTEQLWCMPPRQQEYLPNIPLLIGSETIQPVKCMWNLGIYIDSDLSMKSHISKAVSNCFAVLRRLRGICRLVSQPVLLSLVASLIMTRLDYGSATLAGLPGHLLDRQQSVLNAAARLVCYAQKYDHVIHLLWDLHWLRVPEKIQFRLAVLVFGCRNNTAPPYLLHDLQWTDEVESLQ